MPVVGTANHDGNPEPRFLSNSLSNNSDYTAVILAGGDGVSNSGRKVKVIKKSKKK